MLKFECVMNYQNARIHFNVISEDKTNLKDKALIEAIESLKGFGYNNINPDDINLIGYKDCEPFEFVK